MSSHCEAHHVDRLARTERVAKSIDENHLSVTAVSYWTITILEAPYKLGRALLPICCGNYRVATLDESDDVKVLVASRSKIS